ncbi:MAG: AsmA-like C-terminal region-containing protein [Terriglobia bacterium]|jgi:hypothetical protein
MPKLARVSIIVISLLAILATITVVVLPIALSRYIRRNMITILRERFDSDVEIKGLQVIALPYVYASVERVVLRHKGRTDVAPLMMIHKLSISASIVGLFQSPMHLSSVHLQGLQIHVPPPDKDERPENKEPGKKFAPSVLIDEVISDDALLETLPRDPTKDPRDFQIHSLVLRSFGFDRPATFHAILTNAKPEGQIDSEGQFGPWQAEEPGRTPVAATFRFSNADLGTLRGLSGILSSTGKYGGTLGHLDVEGDTDTPDFAINIGGNPVPLKTHYVAVVDGTNGDTHLTSVEARLGNSTIHSSGDVVGIKGVKGRHILVQAVSTGADIEDFLRLAVKGKQPFMKGIVGLRAKIDLPPREGADIIDRLILVGQFDIAGARFTNPDTQQKLDSLSRRGQGHPTDDEIQDVISNLRGGFVMRGGTITFSNLAFNVPGAAIELNGSYNLENEQLDFHGHVFLDVKLSQTVTGAKSTLLKLVDPFFKRNGGGSSIPIEITGNRSHPDFGLELRRQYDKEDNRRDNK